MEKVLDGVVVDDVGQRAPDEQGGDGDVAGGGVHAGGEVGDGGGVADELEQLWVPVPVPATVAVLAEVLAQSVGRGGAASVGVVGGDRGGGLVQGREAVAVAGHEIEDACGAARVDPGRDVDEHERSGDGVVGVGEQGGDAAQGGADEHGRVAEGAGDVDEVVHEMVDGVVARARPVAVTVSAGVEGERGPAVLGEADGGVVPGMAGLPGSVEQDGGAAR